MRHFNRGTDKIDLSNSSKLQPSTPTLTVAGFATFDSFTSENWCYARYNSGVLPGVHLLRVTTAKHLNGFWLDSGGTGHGPTGAATLAAATLYHVAFVISGSNGAITSTVYLNGSVDGTVGPEVANWGTNTIASRLGSSVSGSTLAGSLAEWGFWASALTANQIKALASGVSPAQIAGGPGYWPLLGDSTEPDYSGNKLNGTVTGTTVVNSPGVQVMRPGQRGFQPMPV